MGLISLGYMGGTIYLLMYVRYCFYDQMIEAMQITNTQLGTLNTVTSVIMLVIQIPGAYLADKLDAKKVIVFTVSGITILTFIYAMFSTSYTVALMIWSAQALVMISYWSCLVKYINNLGGEEESGNSFGVYYLINGLSGALGNAVPLWVFNHFGTFKSVLVTYGIITGIAAILVAVFLDDEKKLAARGVYLKGDDPIQIKHVIPVIKWPGVWILFFAYLATYTIYANVSYFNPYLIDVIGVDPSASSGLSVIRSYGAMVVAPLGGIMCDKVFKSTSTWYIVAFSISAVMFTIPIFFGPDSNATLVSIYSVLPSIVVFALYSVTYSILRELHIPATVAGTAIGVAGLSGTVVDGVWPVLFGSWLDKFGNGGYTMIFLFLVADCVLGVIVALWSKSHDKKCSAGKVMNLNGITENN